MSQTNHESVKSNEIPRPQGRQAAARIEDVTAVGEVLDEHGLRLVAGGAASRDRVRLQHQWPPGLPRLIRCDRRESDRQGKKEPGRRAPGSFSVPSPGALGRSL